MHHPGPPRFVGAGDPVELAPRNPDPSATYRWEVVQQPADSTATLGDGPVEHLLTDVPGTYVARLSAPDGDHHLTVRAAPHDPATEGTPRSDASGGRTGRAGGDGLAEEGYAGADSSDDGGGGRPRLQLDPHVEGDEAVVTAHPRPYPDSDRSPGDIEVEFLVDDRDDVDPDAVTVEGHELRIPIAALSDPTRIHAVALGEDSYSVPDAVAFESEDDGIDTERLYEPPAWGAESTIYEVYVRTFGGEEGAVFDAIVDRLDYIESLGVDVLWLTPVLKNDHAPHGYNITDFFAIAEDLGTREDYERLVAAAHDRGLRVLFDLVCNHSARTHPYFQAAVADTDSEYREWYEWRTETQPETYFEWEHIANFDFGHLPVRRHLLDAIAEWAPLVDGFRCDMAWAVPDSFWREIHDYCRGRDSEFLLLDETIPYIPDFQAGLFEMHFDSTTYHALHRVGNGEDPEVILDAIENRARAGFPDHAGFMLYAENHDETRYILAHGRPAAEAAAGALFTLPGAPLVYAGQEFGQQGRRDDLAWEHAHEDLREHFRALAAVRHDQPALSAEADLSRVDYDVRTGHDDRVVAYARTTASAGVVVVLNLGADPATVAVPAVADRTDLVSGESVAAGGDAVAVDSVAVLPASDK
jgi:glycosidase